MPKVIASEAKQSRGADGIASAATRLRNDSGSRSRNDGAGGYGRAVFWIMMAALVLRCAFLIAHPTGEISLLQDDGFYQESGLRVREYMVKAPAIAKDILTGEFFEQQGKLRAYGLEIPWAAMKRGPVYSFFLAILFLFVAASPMVVYLAQAVLLSAGCGLGYLLGKELEGPRTGILAAALLAIYPPLIFVNSKMYQEPVAAFAILLLGAAMLRWFRRPTRWLSVGVGLLWLTAAFAKSSFVYFPFLLAMVLLCARDWRRWLLAHKTHALLAAAACMIPYLLWTTAVSWQFKSPGTVAVVNTVGRSVLFSNLPDFDGWISDAMEHAKEPSVMREVLEREGVDIPTEEGKPKWPTELAMRNAGFARMAAHPMQTAKVWLLKFGRYWSRPYDWPWRNFAFPHGPTLVFHRVCLILGVLGMVLAFRRMPAVASALIAGPLYGSLFYLIFVIESRYNLPFMPVMIVLAASAATMLLEKHSILISHARAWCAGAAAVMLLAIYGLAKPPFLLLLSPAWQGEALRWVSTGLQIAALAGLVLCAGLWLRPAIGRGATRAAMACWMALVVLPAGVWGFHNQRWHEWGQPLKDSGDAIRQEIVLPPGSLSGVRAALLRIDALLPKEMVAGEVLVNGRRVAAMGDLQSGEMPEVMQKGRYSYSVLLGHEHKEVYEMRQWHTLPLELSVLQEGVNAVEIASSPEGLRGPRNDGESGNDAEFGDTHRIPFSKSGDTHPIPFSVAGDYRLDEAGLQWHGPLFQHNIHQISAYQYNHDQEFRLRGRENFHHAGRRAARWDGTAWNQEDLSSAPGLQTGDYRVRIELVGRDGDPRLY